MAKRETYDRYLSSTAATKAQMFREYLVTNMDKMTKEQMMDMIDQHLFYMKNCKTCDKKFMSNPRNISFCSYICYKQDHNFKRLLQKRIQTDRKTRTFLCKKCGKEYTTKSTNGKYCSDVCRNSYHRHVDMVRTKQGLIKREKVIVLCPMCDKKIEKWNTVRTIYCSESCSARHKTILNRTLPITDRKCLGCDVIISWRDYAHKKYCSSACRYKLTGK